MRLESDHYYHAALERIEQARWLYGRGDSYALAMYVAGVAVECMLRAFKLRRHSVLDERHDLLLLLNTSGILKLEDGSPQKAKVDREERSRIGLRQTVREVAQLWFNDYRYASENRLRTHLRNLKLHIGIKGDYLKANALRLVGAAERFIKRGVDLWTRLPRK